MSLLVCRECGEIIEGPDDIEDEVLDAFQDHLAEHLETEEYVR